MFAVAAHRCSELFDPPGTVTLWRLPEEIEEEFDARWEAWLDNASEWTSFFQRVESIQGGDLQATLHAFELTRDRDVEAFAKLRRRAVEDRAMPIPGLFTATDDEVTLLALGFARGEPGTLIVPYARRSDV